MTADDDAQAAQMRPLLSQVRVIEHLSLCFVDSWGNVAPALRLFASFTSICRLRLCFFWCPDWGAAESGSPLLAPLDVILTSSGNNAFHTLRTVEFAWCLMGSNDTLREQHPILSAWVQRMLPQLHEQHIVKVYAYKYVVILVESSHPESNPLTADPSAFATAKSPCLGRWVLRRMHASMISLALHFQRGIPKRQALERTKGCLPMNIPSLRGGTGPQGRYY